MAQFWFGMLMLSIGLIGGAIGWNLAVWAWKKFVTKGT